MRFRVTNTVPITVPVFAISKLRIGKYRGRGLVFLQKKKRYNRFFAKVSLYLFRKELRQVALNSVNGRIYKVKIRAKSNF